RAELEHVDGPRQARVEAADVRAHRREANGEGAMSSCDTGSGAAASCPTSSTSSCCPSQRSRLPTSTSTSPRGRSDQGGRSGLRVAAKCRTRRSDGGTYRKRISLSMTQPAPPGLFLNRNPLRVHYISARGSKRVRVRIAATAECARQESNLRPRAPEAR